MSAPGGGEWFRTYFDARTIRLYEARQDPEEARVAVAGCMELLGLPQGARVLDLGCGWGRHAFLLDEAGFEVTGVDISEAALGLARERGRASGEGRVRGRASGGEGEGARRAGVRWVRADIRALPFRGGFEGAVSLGSSLGYFGDDAGDRAVLEGVRAVLGPGAPLLIETMHRGPFDQGIEAHERWDEHEGEPVEVERHWDPATGVNRERIVWPDGAEKGHAMLLRDREGWMRLLEEAGFVPERALGGWAGEPFEQGAGVLVLLARRGR